MIQDETGKFWLDREKAMLVVVDVQQRLVPSMDPEVYDKVRRSIDCMVRGAELLDVPVLATEQYPKGLGPTVPELAAACTGQVIEKLSFGCCGEPTFRDHLRGLGRSQVMVTGMEAHVCVYQTVLGLLEAGYRVHLLRDAICSRGKTDYSQRRGGGDHHRNGPLSAAAHRCSTRVQGGFRPDQGALTAPPRRSNENIPARYLQ
jgi:isochorismate hydrolase